MTLPDWSPSNVDLVGPILDHWADQYGLPRDIVYGLVSQESRFNPNAVGDNGNAHGLTQIWLTTAKGMGYGGDGNGLQDPTTSVQWGLLYLRQLLDRFGGDMNVALSAYNGGYVGGAITNPSYVNAVIDRAEYFDQLWAGSSDVVVNDDGTGATGLGIGWWLVAAGAAVWVLNGGIG